MPLLDVLTVNDRCESEEGLLETIYRALEYFPRGLWEGANYLGDINVEYDVKVRSKYGVYGAFVLKNLLEKMKEVKRILQLNNLLLAVTYDPIITVYHEFDAGRFRRVANLVHDYFSRDIGLVSFFRVRDDENAARILAHGLGHSRGLRHHMKPIDIMYVGLLEHAKLENNGFCNECIRKMVDENSI